MAFRNPFISITSFYQTLGWAPTKPMSVLCRKTDTILSVFVGFSLPTQTDTNIFINRHGVGFLSVFCRFFYRFWARILNKTRDNFDIFRTSLWCLETENYKIVINKRLNLLFNLRVHLLSLFIEFL